jgi:hypothetical protein
MKDKVAGAILDSVQVARVIAASLGGDRQNIHAQKRDYPGSMLPQYSWLRFSLGHFPVRGTIHQIPTLSLPGELLASTRFTVTGPIRQRDCPWLLGHLSSWRRAREAAKVKSLMCQTAGGDSHLRAGFHVIVWFSEQDMLILGVLTPFKPGGLANVQAI